MKPITVVLVWLYASLFYTPHGLAHTVVVQEPVLEALATHPVWLKLLAYEEREKHPESAVISGEFFLSPNGKHNALAELRATLEAFSYPAGDNPDAHAQCQFRGRYVWLKRQLNFDEIEAVSCPKFDEWLGEGVESISFILATGYLGNPASFYGHTLIKLNGTSQNGRNSLLDQTINYGAIIPDNENPLVYIVRGISGLYEAGFSNKQYYFHNHNYGETQLRDQWEYELNLTRDEVELVVAHAWELLGRKYDYYFFTYNCAYRMAELLEVIKGISFIPDRTLMIPQTFFQSLAESRYQGKPLVKQVHYHPSRQQRLYQRYELLNDNQKKLMHQWARTSVDFKHQPEYMALTLSEKQTLVDALMDYYQYYHSQVDGAEAASIPNSPEYVATLKERFLLPAGRSDLSSTRPEAPHLGRNPALFRTALVATSESDAGIQITYRPAYYDALDARAGHVKHGKLAMGAMAFTLLDSKLRLDYLDAVAIDSTNAAITGLPGDSGSSWKLRGGLLRQTANCDDCLVPRVSGGIGLAKSLVGKEAVIAGYVEAAVQDNLNDSGYFYGAGTLQLIGRYGEFDGLWSSQLRHHVASDWGEEWVHRAEVRYEPSNNAEFRIQVDVNRGKRFSLGYGVYW